MSSTPADLHARLERGRESFARRAWAEARESLALADEAGQLGGDDLERLAMSAYFIGRADDFLRALERAHQAYLDGGDGERAVRCAFWLSLFQVLRGQDGHAAGWLGRAQRVLERGERDCAEQGYLLLPLAEQKLDAGDGGAAYDTAGDAAHIGERFAEPDLVACARHLQGRALIMQDQVKEGLALLDEAMVGVIAGQLSPLMTGLIYCSVIDNCQQVYALGRAREWTSALSAWCEDQPEMVAFTGTCLAQRAEILQTQGAWREAIAEAQRVCERDERGQAAADAFYQRGEVHRLRGELEAAESAYRSASQCGREPQPGMALLRVAQGRTDAAVAAIRRVVAATTGPWRRARLLPACVDIMLAAGDTQAAREASRELEEIADRLGAAVPAAMAAQARGAVELAEGDAQAALASLRQAGKVWQEVDAPHAAARVRVLAGLACRALGDHDGAGMELDAARAVFDQLGAAPDLAAVDALARPAAPTPHHGLTPRELQVLRLLATGKTNKAIAAELRLSEKTIDRHVSNIFTKLDVPSRAAATAYGYEHKLI
jgi:ATP/maltotriose-dependent transcriptional regulator MalT